MDYKNEIKAIAFDYDGTLIDFDYTISEYTKKAFELLKEKDYKICLSSGRPCYLAVKAFEDAFGDYPLDYIFGCNGSEFLDYKTKKNELLFSMSPEEVRRLEKLLDVEFLTVCIYENDRFLVNKPLESSELNNWLEHRWLTPELYDFQKNDIKRSKVIVLNEAVDREKEIEFLKTIDLSDYSYTYSSMQALEINPRGVNKAKSVEKLCEILNCRNDQILTFGDNDNDMAMLKASTGVIMGNARQELQDMIPLKTGKVNEEGIYEFLKKNELI